MHYFLIKFPQRPGALKDFLANVLGPNDDITYFQFIKKNSRENAPAVIGLELSSPLGLNELKKKMEDHKIEFQYLNDNQIWFDQLVNIR